LKWPDLNSAAADFEMELSSTVSVAIPGDGRSMKFTIQIVQAVDAGERVLHKTSMEAISPKWAKGAAETLFAAYKAKGATGFRILNPHDEEVYRWSK
jgi:uncharacterized lipoprotein